MQIDDNLIFGKVYTFIRCLNVEKNTYQQSAFPRFQIVCAFSFTIYTINSTFNDNIALKRKVIIFLFIYMAMALAGFVGKISTDYGFQDLSNCCLLGRLFLKALKSRYKKKNYCLYFFIIINICVYIVVFVKVCWFP